MEIADSAHRHGVPEEDMRHAIDNRVGEITHRADQPAHARIWIGLDREGRHLEIGVMELDGVEPVLFHAMRLRKNWRRFIGEGS